MHLASQKPTLSGGMFLWNTGLEITPSQKWETMAAHNNNNKNNSTKQWGGVSLFSINKGANHAFKSGSNPTKLGRWVWTCYRGEMALSPRFMWHTDRVNHTKPENSWCMPNIYDISMTKMATGAFDWPSLRTSLKI